MGSIAPRRRATARVVLAYRRPSSGSQAQGLRGPECPKSLDLEFGAYNVAARHHRLELCKRHGARQVFHAAVGRDDEPFGCDVTKCAPYSLGHDLRRLHPVVLEIEHAIHHTLVGQHIERPWIEVWLCDLERDLVRGTSIQWREETVRIWFANFDVVRIAEAQVHDGGSGDALKRPIDAIDRKFIGLSDERFHERFIKLDDVGTCLLVIVDLLVSPPSRTPSAVHACRRRTRPWRGASW